MILCTQTCDGKTIGKKCCIACDEKHHCIYVCESIKKFDANRSGLDKCEYSNGL